MAQAGNPVSAEISGIKGRLEARSHPTTKSPQRNAGGFLYEG